MKKTTLYLVTAVTIAILANATAKAGFYEPFENGFTDNVSITGINGWVSDPSYASGLTARNNLGLGGTWGVKAPSTSYMGSRKDHGMSLANDEHILVSAYIRPMDHATLSSMYVKLCAAGNTTDYITIGLTRVKIGFNCHDSSGWKFLNPLDTSADPLADEFYHVTMDWTVGGNITGTVSDLDDNVITSWTEDLSGWAPSNSLTQLGVYGIRGACVDKIEVCDGTLTTFIPGDTNEDGDVDDDDVVTLTSHWLQSGSTSWYIGDFNDDGIVDDYDATMLAANYRHGAGGVAVPEPGFFVMLLGSLLLLFIAWRR